MPRSPVQALERVVAILEVLRETREPLGVSEIARRLSLAKPSAHRLLIALEEAGMVAATQGRYRLGLQLLHWGVAAAGQFDFRDAARPIMEELVRRTGETVHLAVWNDGHAVYIDRVNGSNAIQLHSSIGGRAPGHATASGLSLLAFQDAPTQADAERRLVRFTPRTIGTAAELRSRLATVRQQGFAMSAEAWREGTAGVAAPVRSHDGEVLASLSVAGPTKRIVERAEHLAKLVRGAADEISQRIGAPDEHPPAGRRRSPSKQPRKRKR